VTPEEYYDLVHVRKFQSADGLMRPFVRGYTADDARAALRGYARPPADVARWRRILCQLAPEIALHARDVERIIDELDEVDDTPATPLVAVLPEVARALGWK